MKTSKATDILKQHDQRVTDKRVTLLKLLMSKSSKAFTLSDIEKQLTLPMDRVTIYRTLQAFEAAGFVIKMVDNKGTSMYMFHHEKHQSLPLHPHLHCTACDEIVCLPTLPADYLKKLENYHIDEIYILMQGKCRECPNTGKKECGR